MTRIACPSALTCAADVPEEPSGALAGCGPGSRIAGYVEIVSQVSSALDAAHEQELVHRDVKPANMLLDSRPGSGRPDHVYLSDFGLSKGTLATTGLTSTGTFLGTVDYISPEQIEGKAPGDRWARCAEFAEALRSSLGITSYDAGEQAAQGLLR
jgi:serine/threonine protein kinase